MNLEGLESNREPNPQGARGHQVLSVPVVGGGVGRGAGECPASDPREGGYWPLRDVPIDSACSHTPTEESDRIDTARPLPGP